RPFMFTAVAKGKDVIYRARLEPDHVSSIDQFQTGHIRPCVFNYCFIESGRQRVYHIDHAHYFGVLPVSHFGRNEYPEVADFLMEAINYSLVMSDDLVHTVVQVRDPVKRLLRGSNIVEVYGNLAVSRCDFIR